MSFTFTMPAPEGDRFAPTAFAGQIGRSVPLKFELEQVAVGVITAAVVSDDGLFVEITIEPVMVHDCSRCGRPASEHTDGECPPPL